MAVNTKMPLTNTADGYLCEGTDIKGGYFVIDDKANIPSTIAETGSLCYCQADSKFYQYNGTAWVEKEFGTTTEATDSAAGLMSASDKQKLTGIASGAEKNQNAFSNITVGSTTVSADTATDTLALVAGSNVTITPDATNDKITIAATDTVFEHPNHTARDKKLYKVHVDGFGHVDDVSEVAKADITALGIPGQDTTYSEVVAKGAAGLMSGADKDKLDNIANGAEVNVQSDWNQADNTKDDFIKNKPPALKNPNALSIGGKSYDGSSAVSITATELRTHLGIDNALHFIGLTTTDISDNATTNPITVNGKSHTAVAGDVVLYNDNEYVFDGNKWLELGDGSSHALKSIKINAGAGLTGGGTLANDVTLNVGEGNGITVSADAVAAKAGNGITVDATGINHADTSTQASITASGRKYITGVTLDTYGHVTGLTTGTETVTDTNTWRKVQLDGVDKLGNGITTNPLNIKAGTNVTITENAGTFTFSATNTDTKVTSVDNHYTPTADSTKELSVDANSTTSAAWGSTDLVTGVNIQRDAKGHVTGVTVDSVQMPANPNSETTLTITDKSNTDTSDLVYAVTNLVESGTKGHAITSTYTGLPTKSYVDNKVSTLISSGTTDPTASITSQYYFKY